MIGSLPAQAQRVTAEIARRIPPVPLYVGASGGFTIERIHHAAGWPEIHGNDVTLYTSALAAHLTGGYLPVKTRTVDGLGILDDLIDDPAGLAAAVQLVARLGEHLGPNPYHRRMYAAHLARLPDDLVTTRARIIAGLEGVTLTSYTCGDVVDYAEQAPTGAVFAAFPPPYENEYERLYRYVDAVFDWPRPDYPIFDRNRLEALLDVVEQREHWMIWTKDELEHRTPLARTRASLGARPLWLYGSESIGSTFFAGPKTTTENIGIPFLGPDDPIEPPLTLVPMTGGQLARLRNLYLNPTILPGQAKLVLGVCSAGKLVGVLGLGSPTHDTLAHGSMELVADFPIRPTCHPRLSKLVIAAALSHEAKHVMEQRGGARVDRLQTTVFSQRAVSMKYRGSGFEITKREPGKIRYQAAAGQWTLEEALNTWRKQQTK